MRIRRCALLLIEPRERLEFSLESLCSGGDGIDADIDLLALAPHAGTEIAITFAEARILAGMLPSKWVDFDEVARRFEAASVLRLLEVGLLISDAEAHSPARTLDEALRAANWHAHSAVSHYLGRWHGVTSGEDLASSGVSTMSEMFQRLGAPPPAARDRVEPGARVSLQAPVHTPVDEILARRATCRNFDPAAVLDGATFAAIMHRVFGAQAVYEIHADNVVIKRNSPSGGGLHPTEAYVVVRRVDGIEPGLYHYHSIDHALEPLPPPASGSLESFVRIMVAAQKYFLDAPAFVIMATRFPRTFWKYRNHSKAYRATILDAGHLSQTLYLSAAEFGLGAFITAAINEREIEQAFGLDPLVESPIAVLGFGARAAKCETFEFDPNRKVWRDGVEQPQ